MSEDKFEQWFAERRPSGAHTDDETYTKHEMRAAYRKATTAAESELTALRAKVGELENSNAWLKDQLEYWLKASKDDREKASQLTAELALARRGLEREQRDHETTIRQRDVAQDAADVLAHGIARIYDSSKDAIELIGEHSNLNCPWDRAGELLEQIPVDARRGLQEGVLFVRTDRGKVKCGEWYDASYGDGPIEPARSNVNWSEARGLKRIDITGTLDLAKLLRDSEAMEKLLPLLEKLSHTSKVADFSACREAAIAILAAAKGA